MTVRIPGVALLPAIFAAAVCLPPPVIAQTCTWGGTSALEPPVVERLRAYVSEVGHPGRVAVGPDGAVYVTDPDGGRVVTIDFRGRVIDTRGGFLSPLAIAIGNDRRIYLGELGSGSVSVFGPNWDLLFRLGNGSDEFLVPNDMAIDPDPARAALYVSDGGDHTIKIYSLDGAKLGSIGGKGSDVGNLDFPAAVHVTQAGEIVVGDANNDRVQIFDRDGAVLRCFGRRGGMSFGRRFGRISGITSDKLGRLYVADAFQGRISVFDSQGKPLSTIAGFGVGEGELLTPIGLEIDPFNRLFVASRNGEKVEVFGLDDFVDAVALAAEVSIEPRRLNRKSRRRWVTVTLGVEDSLPIDVDRRTVTANGIPAESRPWGIDDDDDGDDDGDHDDEFEAPRLKFKVSAPDLLETLADGPVTVLVAGTLIDGTPFEGVGEVMVFPEESQTSRSRGGRR